MGPVGFHTFVRGRNGFSLWTGMGAAKTLHTLNDGDDQRSLDTKSTQHRHNSSSGRERAEGTSCTLLYSTREAPLLENHFSGGAPWSRFDVVGRSCREPSSCASSHRPLKAPACYGCGVGFLRRSSLLSGPKKSWGQGESIQGETQAVTGSRRHRQGQLKIGCC